MISFENRHRHKPVTTRGGLANMTLTTLLKVLLTLKYLSPWALKSPTRSQYTHSTVLECPRQDRVRSHQLSLVYPYSIIDSAPNNKAGTTTLSYNTLLNSIPKAQTLITSFSALNTLHRFFCLHLRSFSRPPHLFTCEPMNLQHVTSYNKSYFGRTLISFKPSSIEHLNTFPLLPSLAGSSSHTLHDIGHSCKVTSAVKEAIV